MELARIPTLSKEAKKLGVKNVMRVPDVLQGGNHAEIGKWRREIMIPSVAECADTPITDANRAAAYDGPDITEAEHGVILRVSLDRPGRSMYSHRNAVA